MACTPILSYSNNCNKATIAGISNLYLIGYNDLKPVTGQVEPYTIGTNDMVNAISLAVPATVKFVKIGILPKAVAIKDSYTFDASKGVGSFDQELTLPVTNVSTEARKLVKSASSAPVCALIKLTSGVWVAMGLNGMMNLTAAEGTVTGSDNGYSLTFSGFSDDFMPIVDPTIIPALIA